jgi:hypothetical protein
MTDTPTSTHAIKPTSEPSSEPKQDTATQSERLDNPVELDALIKEWKEIDMPTLNLAFDTGRMRGRAQLATWSLRLILLALVVQAALLAPRLVEGETRALATMGMLVLSGALIVFLARWLKGAMGPVDTALADGGPGAMLEARLHLLDAALWDATSKTAMLIQFALAPVAIGLGFLAMVMGWVPWWLPTATMVTMGALVTWVRLVRVPRLRRERDAVLALRDELREGDDTT